MSVARARLLIVNGLRSMRRDRTALFFTFLMPVVFLSLFALIFGRSTTSRPTVAVVGSGPVVSALRQVDALDVVSRLEAPALASLHGGDIAGVVIVRGTTIDVRYAQSDPIEAAVVQGVVRQVTGALDLAAAHVKPTYTVTASRVEDVSISGIDFYLPGVLAFSVAQSALFGVSITLVLWRTRGLLRRLRLTPVRLAELIVSRIAISLLVAIAQTTVMLGIGIVLFGVHLRGQWWLLYPVVLVGTTCFLALGLISGAVARTEDSAVAIAQVVVLPMTFISGVWFPVDGIPSWLKVIADILPLRHLIRALTDVAIRGEGLGAVAGDLGIMLAFTVVLGAVALRLFRWDRA